MTSSTSSRRRLVGVSTKMYFDIHKTSSYVQSVLQAVPSLLPELSHPTDVFIIPDFITLQSVSSSLKSTPIHLGAQDVWTEDTGAFTGEVSPLVLAQSGVKFVEIGHAERRRLFGETDGSVVAKAVGCARNGLVPLVCVGEVTQGGGVEQAVEECWQQVEGVLESIDEHAEVVLAYEPVWAIGKSEPASAQHVVAVTKRLREKAEGAKGGKKRTLRILYGGSAGPGLFAKLEEGVDGLFLGRFAHDPKAFVETITEVGGGRK